MPWSASGLSFLPRSRETWHTPRTGYRPTTPKGPIERDQIERDVGLGAGQLKIIGVGFLFGENRTDTDNHPR
jgi:hypothetical protein